MRKKLHSALTQHKKIGVVVQRSHVKNKAAMCCALGKKRMTEALRSCDYCTSSLEERSECYRAVAKDTGLRAKTCILM